MRGPSRLVTALTVLLAACTRLVVPEPGRPLGAITHDATLDNGFLSVHLDVPVSPPGPKPAVIWLLDDPTGPLEAGMVVASFGLHFEDPALDPSSAARPLPEQSVGTWLLAAPTPRTVGARYFELINVNAAYAVPRVLDFLANTPDVDPTRIGVVGAATNGFIALQAAATDRRLGVVAALFACGDYHQFLRLSALGMNGAQLDLDPTYDRWLEERAPIRHPERVLHAALLAVNGTADATIPPACAAETTRVLGDAYTRAGHPERFRAVSSSAGGEALAAEARREALAWLVRWLAPGREAERVPPSSPG